MAQVRVERPLPFPLSVGRFLLRRTGLGLESVGNQLDFYLKALGGVATALVKHLGESLRLVGDITWGAGALIVGAGTAGVIFFMS